MLVGVFLKIRCEHCEIQNVTGGRQWLPLVSTPVGKCEEYAALFCILAHRPFGLRRHFGNLFQIGMLKTYEDGPDIVHLWV